MATGLWVFLSGLAIALIAPMVAHAIKLAEFRQAWINELRKDIADYLGLARKWARAYEEYERLASQQEPPNIEAKMDEVASIMNDARVIMWRIQMRINPNDNRFKTEDDLFLTALSNVTDVEMVNPTEPDVPARWNELAKTLVVESRLLLKREWDVTKRSPPRWLFDSFEKSKVTLNHWLAARKAQ